MTLCFIYKWGHISKWGHRGHMNFFQKFPHIQRILLVQVILYPSAPIAHNRWHKFMGCFMLLYMLKECHISIMRAQLLINMIITWVSKICELVPYTDINPLLRRQLILLNVLIYDSHAVCGSCLHMRWTDPVHLFIYDPHRCLLRIGLWGQSHFKHAE